MTWLPIMPINGSFPKCRFRAIARGCVIGLSFVRVSDNPPVGPGKH